MLLVFASIFFFVYLLHLQVTTIPDDQLKFCVYIFLSSPFPGSELEFLTTSIDFDPLFIVLFLIKSNSASSSFLQLQNGESRESPL
jgi:hypothetical protein